MATVSIQMGAEGFWLGQRDILCDEERISENLRWADYWRVER
jgi:hypothetical protein